MIWKLSIYALLIALPAGIFTSVVDVKEKREDFSKVIAAASEEKADGAILGSVIAPGATVEIQAENGKESITGGVNEAGEFFINGFSEGTYTVMIKALDKNNKVKTHTFDDVEIKIGEVTALGTVTLN